MSLIFELQRVYGTKQDFQGIGQVNHEQKELVSEVEWNLGAVHDSRTTRHLGDNKEGSEQQEQG